MDKRNKEILYPTLIACTYMNERSLAILQQEIDVVILYKYLEQNIKIELPRILEESNEYCSEHSRDSGSATSVQMDFLNGNNPYLPLYMRFPKQYWKEAAKLLKPNE